MLDKTSTTGIADTGVAEGSCGWPRGLRRTGSEHVQRILVDLIFTMLAAASATGWVINIVKLANSEKLFTGMNAARAFGIFVAPMGAILGFI